MKDIDKVTPHPIVQMCWVVDDMEAAALQWVKIMGAGPFFRIPHIQLDELTYRGKPVLRRGAVGNCAGRTLSATLPESVRRARNVCSRTNRRPASDMVCS